MKFDILEENKNKTNRPLNKFGSKLESFKMLCSIVSLLRIVFSLRFFARSMEFQLLLIGVKASRFALVKANSTAK